MQLPDHVIHFLEGQGFVIVSTLDPQGRIHCSAKGIVGIEKEGKVLVIDVYRNNTFKNLKNDLRVSITSVDEDKFMGFTLQGTARIVPREDMEDHIVARWEDRVIKRISKRIAMGIKAGARSKNMFEAELPRHPKYLIEINVENIIDLSPPQKLP